MNNFFYEAKPTILIIVGIIFLFLKFPGHEFVGMIYFIFGGYIMGMRSIYRKHVPKLSKRIKQLENISKGNNTYNWKPQEREDIWSNPTYRK